MSSSSSSGKYFGNFDEQETFFVASQIVYLGAALEKAEGLASKAPFLEPRNSPRY
jgi:hypothetical protein